MAASRGRADNRRMDFETGKLRSQHLRGVNFQGDALRMGMNWTEEDLGKPQILVDSAYGMGHPGTFHFRPLGGASCRSTSSSRRPSDACFSASPQ